MGIPQESNAVFYHPLDGSTESLTARAWAGDASWVDGKVGPAMAGGAEASGPHTAVPTGPATDLAVVLGMSSDTFVIARGAGNYVAASVCTVSGQDITFGPEHTSPTTLPDSGASQAARLDDEWVVFGSPGKCMAASVSGTGIDFGTAVQYDPAYGEILCAIDSTKFLVQHQQYMRIGTRTGFDLTFGASQTVMTTSQSLASAVGLSGPDAVVAWYENASPWRQMACALNVSGDDIQSGTPVLVDDAATSGTAVIPLDSTRAAIFYGGATHGGFVRVATANGLDLTLGAATGPFTVNFYPSTSQTLGVNVIGVDSSTALIIHDSHECGDSDRDRISTRIVTFDGDAATPHDPVEYHPPDVDTSAPRLARLGASGSYIAMYTTPSPSAPRMVSVVTVDGAAGKLGTTAIGEFGYRAMTYHVSAPQYQAATAIDDDRAVVCLNANSSSFGYVVEKCGPTGLAIQHSGQIPHSNPMDLAVCKVGDVLVSAASYYDAADRVGFVSVSPEPFNGWTDVGEFYRVTSGAGPSDVNIAPIDSSRFALCWIDGDDGYGKAAVGFVNGYDITFGNVVSFSGTLAAANCDVAALAADKIVVCYTIGADGKAAVGTVDGAELAFPVSFEFASPASAVHVAAFDSATFAVAWNDGDGKVRSGSVAGSDITFGPPATYATGSSTAAMSRLDSTAVAVCWYQSNVGRCATATLTGADLSLSPVTAFEPDASTHSRPQIVPFGGDVLVAYGHTVYSSGGGVVRRAPWRPADPHQTAIAATRLAFSAWVGRSASPATTQPPATTTAPPVTTAPPLVSDAPTVDSPLAEGATAVTGTSTEADGTVIQVYIAGAPHGSTTTVSGGAWSQSVPALAGSVAVKATAQAVAEGVSPDSNTVIVTPLVATSRIFTETDTWDGRYAVCALTSDKFAVAYNEGTGSPGQGRVRIGQYVGAAITFGPSQDTIGGVGWTGYGNLVRLTDTKLVLTGMHGAVVGDVTGLAVAFGSTVIYPSPAAVIPAADQGPCTAAARLSDDRFVAVWHPHISSSTLIQSAAAGVSGTVITWGTIQASTLYNGDRVSIAALDSTRCVVVSHAAGVCRAAVCSTAFTTVTWGAAVEIFNKASGEASGVCAIDSSTAVAGLTSSAVRVGYAKALKVVGTDITMGGEVHFSGVHPPTSNIQNMWLSPVDGSRFLASYSVNDNNYSHYSKVGTVGAGGSPAGTAITFGPEATSAPEGYPENWDNCQADALTAAVSVAVAPLPFASQHGKAVIRLTP